jgi:hypothetical protein
MSLSWQGENIKFFGIVDIIDCGPGSSAAKLHRFSTPTRFESAKYRLWALNRMYDAYQVGVHIVGVKDYARFRRRQQAASDLYEKSRRILDRASSDPIIHNAE